MENVPTRAVARKPAEELFASAGTFMGRVWSAVRAFRGALHQEPGGEGFELRPPSLPERGELPESYGRTKVVAMAVNPYLIHVYWEVAAAQRESPEPASLRFHETGTGNAFDVNVDLSAKNWYVHLWSPDERYEVELGIRRDGEFVPLARSNAVQTPRAWPVAEVRESYTRAPEPKREEPPPQRSAVPATQIEHPPEAPRPMEHAPEAKPLPVAAAAPTPAATAHAAAPTRETEGRPAATTAARPTRASDVLRERLSTLYGFRRWEHPPRSAPQGSDPGPAPKTVRQEMDLTARAETHFAPGVSSRQPRS